MHKCLMYALFFATASACFLPLASPGLKADIGPAVAVNQSAAPQPALSLTAGLSLASILEPRALFGLDVGTGYLLSYTSSIKRLDGAYLEAGAWHPLGPHTRLGATGRAELLLNGSGVGLGGVAHLAFEWFIRKQGDFTSGPRTGCEEHPRVPRPGDPPRDPGQPAPTETQCPKQGLLVGSTYGNSGVGVWLDAGVRQLPGGGGPSIQLALGLSVRLPAAWGYLFWFPFFGV